MTRLYRWFLAVLVLCLAASTRPVFADIIASGSGPEDPVKKSHSLDKLSLPAGDPDELFQLLLQGKRRHEIAEALAKRKGLTSQHLDLLKNPSFMAELRKFELAQLPPALKKQLQVQGIDAGKFQEILKQIKPEDLQRVLENQKQIGGRQRPRVNSGGPEDANFEAGRPGDRRATASVLPLVNPESERPEPESNKPDLLPANSRLARWMLQLANRAQANPYLGDSPALRHAIHSLSKYAGAEDQRWQQLGADAETLGEKWTNWSEAIGLDRFLPEEGWSWPRSLTPSAFPRLRWTSPKIAVAEARPFGARAFGNLDSPSEDVWRTALAVIGLGAFGLIAWRVLALSRNGRLTGIPGGWTLGPWPIHPTSVRTREDLIRAFEYLSVFCLGPDARNWNHRAIAVSLGSAGQPEGIHGTGEQRRRAADRLAALYEQARYAPPQEILSDDALTHARRELCLLAGVNTP